MGKMILSLMVFMSATAFAKSYDINKIAQVKRLMSLNGSQGKLVKSYDPSAGQRCQLVAELEEGDLVVKFVGTGMYFDPTAIVSEKAKSLSETSLLVSTNSNRPGGDACGDSGGAVNYKQVIGFDGNKISIIESFRCLGDALQKSELETTCEF